jgi:BASS family bile acid:Na+ symporter
MDFLAKCLPAVMLIFVLSSMLAVGLGLTVPEIVAPLRSVRLVVVNFASVLSVFGTRGILAGVLFNVAGFAVGWLLGGPAADTRVVLGLGTAQRNIAAAIVVGSQSFTDPKVVVMVVVVAIVGLFILMPLSRKLAGGRTPQ